jgi:hypothetical protein
MSFIPKPHEIYKHFKGNLYQIVAVATHSETGEELVIYQALYGDFKIYARPLAMFVSEVDREKYPDVTQRFRFELQGEDSGRQVREYESLTDNRDNQGAENEIEMTRKENNGNKTEDTRTTEIMTSETEKPEDEQNDKFTIDPMVLEFLDSDSYAQKLNILAGLHHRITDDMITTMAVACDVEVGEGDTEKRYVSLRNCLLTMEKYECNRLR